ncbi:MAG: hypothetical protein U0169_13885 [Polyangiaceae bacterium]
MAVRTTQFGSHAPRASVTFRAALVAVSFGACSTAQRDGTRVVLAPEVLAPRALLDRVQRLVLDVHDANGLVCDEATGIVSGLLPNASPVASAQLGTGGCKEGARFCGTLDLARGSTPRIVLARGLSGDDLVATGCASLVADKETQELTIRMVRVVKADVCGDGIVGATEQCDPPGVEGDDVCDASCHTREVFLSKGSGASGGTQNGKRGDKTKPSLVWPLASGRAGKFLAFFGDRASPGQTEVTVRARSDVFGRYGEQGPGVENDSFFLPHDPGGAFPPTASPFNQSAPSATHSGTRTFVAFQDDSGGTVDVKLRSMTDAFVAEQPAGGAVVVNGSGDGEPGIQDSPQVAASPSGTLLVAWRDAAGGGRIFARTMATNGFAPGPVVEVSSGTGNLHPSLAATSQGFVCVWETGADVRMRSLGLDGTPTTPATVVNDASRASIRSEPVVAALEGGEIAVAWTESTDATGRDVFVQRFSESGGRTPGDQGAPLHASRDGNQFQPALAAFEGSGSGFIVVWADDATGHVWSRILRRDGGTSFNPVDGQATEFVASRAESRTRANPSVIVGGSGPSIVIAWEDTTSDSVAGIYGRRFPVPVE